MIPDRQKALWPALFVGAFTFFTTPAFANFGAESAGLRIQKLLSNPVSHSGPNCWNSVLMVAGLNTQPRFTSAEEFNFLMESPLCEKIKSDEKQPGDIQVIRHTISFLDSIEREVHASIYLSKEKLFSKKTMRFTEQYKIVSEADVMETYLVVSPIRRFSKVVNGRYTPVPCHGTECTNKIEYRRCQNRETIIKNLSLSDQRKWQTVLELEAAIGKLVRSYLPNEPEELGLILEQIKQLEGFLQTETASVFLSEYIEVALISFREQLEVQQPKEILTM